MHRVVRVARRALGTLALGAVVAGMRTGCTVAADEAPQEALPRTESLMERALFGAFTYGGVWSGMDPVLALESELGRRLDVVHWFAGWDTPFYPEMVRDVAEGGRLPLVSWESVGRSVEDVADGVHDAYVRSWARGVAASPGLVYVRPFPEMNGDWTPWNGDPDALVRAWRRLARLFDEEGAANVRWVFSPNVTDEPRTEANRMEAYYPGDDVVDVLALDGYNWGSTRDWSTWTSFDEVFREGYDRIVRLGPQPVWFAELASADEGGNKAAWVRDMFASSAFPRVQALVWFDEDKEADWRVASAPEVLDAFRTGLGTPRPLGGALASIR